MGSALIAGLRGLTPLQRLVFILIEFKGLSTVEAAEATGRSLNSIWAAHRDARSRLAALLETGELGKTTDHSAGGRLAKERKTRYVKRRPISAGQRAYLQSDRNKVVLAAARAVMRARREQDTQSVRAEVLDG